jgi:hypothetical protein
MVDAEDTDVSAGMVVVVVVVVVVDVVVDVFPHRKYSLEVAV